MKTPENKLDENYYKSIISQCNSNWDQLFNVYTIILGFQSLAQSLLFAGSFGSIQLWAP